MLVAYVAAALLLLHRWVPAIVAFSAAVSIKMNVLLMAPPVLLLALKVCSQTGSTHSLNRPVLGWGCLQRGCVHKDERAAHGPPGAAAGPQGVP